MAEESSNIARPLPASSPFSPEANVPGREAEEEEKEKEKKVVDHSRHGFGTVFMGAEWDMFRGNRLE